MERILELALSKRCEESTDDNAKSDHSRSFTASTRVLLELAQLIQDVGKGGLSLRGVGVMTDIAETVTTVVVASLSCIL